MTRRAAIGLWLAFAFVTWNVVFDRHVERATVEFTREQVLRHQQGEAVTSIHAGVSPRVREAAWLASAWVGPILAAGVLALSFRSGRSS